MYGYAVDSSPANTAQVLTQALPYIQRFANTTVVVKFGGNAMVEPELMDSFANDIVLMHSVGIKPVVVHGGGPQIAQMLERLGKESVFVDGLRVTDAETLEVARMVLGGKVSRDIVAAINARGPLAVGVSGEDANLIIAARQEPQSPNAQHDLGYVGQIMTVNPELIQSMHAQSLIPVVSTLGSDGKGQAYNINADTVAGHLAAALNAEKLIMLSNVEGLRREPKDPSSLISKIDREQLQALVGTDTVAQGMIPKVQACLHALNNGVKHAHMLDGTTPHVLLLELFTNAGIGTMITQ